MDVKGNHYTCYDVKDFAGKFDPRKVTIKDQFGGNEALVVEVQALCTPAEKNGEGIENKDAHLLCYRLEKGQEARLDISATNQFGSELLWIRDAIALCVPSTKEVI